MDFGQGLTDAWSSIARFVPHLLLFVIVLGVGYAIAKVLSKAMSKALERVGFDRAVERGGIRKMLAKSQYDASDLMAKVVFYGIMLFVLKLAFGAFGPENAGTTLLDSVIGYLPNVLAAAAIVVVSCAIAAVAREFVDAALDTQTYATTIANVAGGAIVAVGVFAALDQLQIGATITNAIFYAMLAAVVGVTVVAVGGSGIRPMQKVWEQSITKVGEESQAIRKNGSLKDRVADRAQQRQEQARSMADQPQKPQEQHSQQDDLEVDVRQQSISATTVNDIWGEEDDEPRGGGRRPQGF